MRLCLEQDRLYSKIADETPGYNAEDYLGISTSVIATHPKVGEKESYAIFYTPAGESGIHYDMEQTKAPEELTQKYRNFVDKVKELVESNAKTPSSMPKEASHLSAVLSSNFINALMNKTYSR
jgi:hypothetical protein